MTPREQALQAQDLASEPVEVPEWGLAFTVREMPELERVAFDGWNSDQVQAGVKDYSAFRCRLIAGTLCDADGQRVFSADDVPALQQKSARVIDRLAEVALRVNRMRAEDLEAAEKKSAAATGNDSSTDSPWPSDASTST